MTSKWPNLWGFILTIKLGMPQCLLINQIVLIDTIFLFGDIILIHVKTLWLGD